MWCVLSFITMGLDQYAVAIKPKVADLHLKAHGGDLTDDEVESLAKGTEQLMQWRKHPNLNEWMSNLWSLENGDEEFNCQPLELTLDDIEALEKSVTEDKLPHGEGFFWGTTQPEHKEDDLKFIKLARKSLESGKRVFYSCWW